MKTAFVIVTEENPADFGIQPKESGATRTRDGYCWEIDGFTGKAVRHTLKARGFNIVSIRKTLL